MILLTITENNHSDRQNRERKREFRVIRDSLVEDEGQSSKEGPHAKD